MRKEFKIQDPYEHELHTYLWETKLEPKGVVQIIHGASEYMDRYDDFAKYLNSIGFHVIGNDHLGHGKTANPELNYVYFESTIGFHQLYDGIKIVRDYITEHYDNLPVIMFAHSMGSFIGRYAIIHDHKRYDQAIFSGTGLFSGFSIALGRLIAAIISKIKGKTYVSHFFNHRILDTHVRNMMKNGIINQRIEWLTQRVEVQRAFKADPLCGKPFSIGAQQDILRFLPEIQDKRMIKSSASATAIFFVSGELDGLGHYGVDAKKLYNMYHDCGYSNVKYTVLNNTRHEIINATDYESHYKLLGDWMIRNL
jgi:alpha-beta hydrolase superfamily lysophospholipase